MATWLALVHFLSTFRRYILQVLFQVFSVTVARIYMGMPIHTGICGKLHLYRPYFRDFVCFFLILPIFCDFVQVQSVIELFVKQVNNALNVH